MATSLEDKADDVSLEELKRANERSFETLRQMVDGYRHALQQTPAVNLSGYPERVFLGEDGKPYKSLLFFGESYTSC